MNLKANCLRPASITSAGIRSISGDLCLFSFSIAMSTSKPLCSGTRHQCLCLIYRGCQKCIHIKDAIYVLCVHIFWHPLYFCMSYIIVPMYIQLLREMVPPSSQNRVRVYKQTTLLILYDIMSKLVTLL